MIREISILPLGTDSQITADPVLNFDYGDIALPSLNCEANSKPIRVLRHYGSQQKIFSPLLTSIVFL